MPMITFRTRFKRPGIKVHPATKTAQSFWSFRLFCGPLGGVCGICDLLGQFGIGQVRRGMRLSPIGCYGHPGHPRRL